MTDTDRPLVRSTMLRAGYGVAAALAAIALALHASNWVRSGTVKWGPGASMVGLLILMLTGALDVPRGTVRNTLSAVGVSLVLVGAAILFLGA
jgi:hypothetical protein